jgi:hypothetical protein
MLIPTLFRPSFVFPGPSPFPVPDMRTLRLPSPVAHIPLFSALRLIYIDTQERKRSSLCRKRQTRAHTIARERYPEAMIERTRQAPMSRRFRLVHTCSPNVYSPVRTQNPLMPVLATTSMKCNRAVIWSSLRCITVIPLTEPAYVHRRQKRY